MKETKICPFCAEEIKNNAIKCKHCASNLNGEKITKIGREMKYKDKNITGLLALILGGLGLHKFYLGKPIQGLVYLVFIWTFIPAIIGFVEGIIYLTMTQEKFDSIYNNKDIKKTSNNIKENVFSKEVKLGFDKGKSLNISSGKGLFTVIIFLLILYYIIQWFTGLVVNDSIPIIKETSYNLSESCKKLNSEIRISNLIPLEDCILLDKKLNTEKVKGGFKYGYTKDEAGTGWLVCDILFDSDKIISKKCFINKSNLEPLK